MTTFFQYATCSTCRKAKSWLGAEGVAFEDRPIVDRPPTVEELRSLWKRSGLPLKRFFNTSGQSYRALDREALERTDDEGRLKLLAADGKLIKRPLLDDGKNVLVGFDADAWADWKAAR
ncbi:MAG: hypothetical protein RL199_1310 [Pseudomonadota bacterium]|jgi:arsenate reductase